MANMPGMTHTDDKGLSLLSNGHHHVIGEEHALSRATRAQLADQVEMTIATAKRYPTVADAMAAGYQRVGPYLPGIGAHFIRLSPEGFNLDGVMDDADLEHPLAMIYSGTDPADQIAGFMYYSMAKEMPKGFAGGNDVWHFHEDLCLKYSGTAIDAPYGLDHSATKKQCEAAGGRLMPQTQWMVHVWSVPGWESRQGLFGEVNPALDVPGRHLLPVRAVEVALPPAERVPERDLTSLRALRSHLCRRVRRWLRRSARLRWCSGSWVHTPCARRSPRVAHSSTHACVASSTTRGAASASNASTHRSAQRHHWSPGTRPANPYWGIGVDRSLPARREKSRNSAVMTTQTAWTPTSSAPVSQHPLR